MIRHRQEGKTGWKFILESTPEVAFKVGCEIETQSPTRHAGPVREGFAKFFPFILADAVNDIEVKAELLADQASTATAQDQRGAEHSFFFIDVALQVQ